LLKILHLIKILVVVVELAAGGNSWTKEFQVEQEQQLLQFSSPTAYAGGGGGGYKRVII
jgi:hypothetical protein